MSAFTASEEKAKKPDVSEQSVDPYQSHHSSSTSQVQSTAESAFDINYKVGLEICNSLPSNQITAFELGQRVAERQKQYPHAGEETWDSDFGSGVGQAVLDKHVQITLN